LKPALGVEIRIQPLVDVVLDKADGDLSYNMNDYVKVYFQKKAGMNANSTKISNLKCQEPMYQYVLCFFHLFWNGVFTIVNPTIVVH
jgi:hypothetical protein